MNGQRGSILVGVMALSLVMTVAASGFILLSANTENDGSGPASNLQLHYAAESGMHMGVRWTRNYSPLKVNNIPTAWIPDTLVLTPGADGFTAIDGIPVKVTIHSTPGGGIHTQFLTSLATLGPHQDSVEITQAIYIAVGGGPLASTPVLSDWNERNKPGKP